MKKIKYKFQNIYEPNNSGNSKCFDWLVDSFKENGINEKIYFYSEKSVPNSKTDEDTAYEWFIDRGGYLYIYDYIPPDKILSSCYLEYIGFEEVEVEYKERVTKLKPGPVRSKINWKSSNKGPVKVGRPSHDTKLPGPIRDYKSVKENGFTRLNKPKSPPKGKIVGIFSGV
tara:strand:- start:145 stop:657 length:513 start_codon:yes stop_codon:yes gene_type:complete